MLNKYFLLCVYLILIMISCTADEDNHSFNEKCGNLLTALLTYDEDELKSILDPVLKYLNLQDQDNN